MIATAGFIAIALTGFVMSSAPASARTLNECTANSLNKVVDCCKQVVKKNRSRVDYDREKLAASFWLALRKRPATTEAVEGAITRIEEKLLALGEREIPSEKVGEMVMRELKKLDKVAYIRFASVYRDFEDVDDFSDMIREISPKSPSRRGR